MMKRNYQIELEKIITAVQAESNVPRLLLHSCCAPCSSYVLEYLADFFAITVFYYNPNIYPDAEYWKRVQEQKKFIYTLPVRHKVDFIEGKYEPELFYRAVKGCEDAAEGGERCFSCYRLRLEKTARLAQQMEMDYFCTTLSVSPHKNAAKINEIGQELETAGGISWLPADFKKKAGYQRSTELSRKYGLYRQAYCGCTFSRKGTEK